ncbi:hypothetical protein CLOSTHATH_02552 [Hungatella hathewayi DSM 13479]|uniref:Uncharacterized protein n=1 Tax=Hungatella hathewayi DSM 13479 TaxID=566550 RepID=D3AG16_9FIRM|nr:hypothetical protein CLOSTHATH_02552 [Hungatella hathewayi DSM 13479]
MKAERLLYFQIMNKNTLTNFFQAVIFYTYNGGDVREFHRGERSGQGFWHITPLFRFTGIREERETPL